MLALTPISPFRPRRWSGAILPDDTAVCMRVLEAENRPVSAVADQVEVRDVSKVEVRLDRERSLTLLFDPEHALDERIAMGNSRLDDLPLRKSPLSSPPALQLGLRAAPR